MKKLILAAIALMAILNSTYAQELLTGEPANEKIQGTSLIKVNPESKVPIHIIFQKENEVAFANIQQWIIGNFKLPATFSLKQIGVEHDQMGMEHYRYQQLYNNIPVEGSMYIVHVKDGMVQSMSGVVFSEINQPSSSSIQETQAIEAPTKYIGATVYKWQIPQEEQFIKTKTGDANATWYPKGSLVYMAVAGNFKTTNYRLAWKFDIYASKPLSRDYVYVDATTGEIISKITRIEDANVQGTAITVYDGTKTITTDSYNGSYRLRETDRGNGIQTYNMHAGTNYGAATDFTDADNTWNNVNAALDQYATDAHYGGEMTYDYYKTTYNRNSIDANGLLLELYVHYDQNYDNAFWDGQEMNFGDGDGTQYHPFTSLDVTGHEITHGLTQYTAGLQELNESGALNESFSDCFGNTIEGFARGGVINWNIAEDLGSPPFRNMANPKQYGQPNTYMGTNWYTGANDNGGVHQNNGVQNYWYYLLVNGGSGTNDNNTTYNITGLGITKAAAITFRSLTMYVTPTSQYADARYWSIQAATDLYGPCSNEVIQVTNAWNAVGVGAKFVASVTASFSASPTFSCSAPIQFTNLSTNAGTFEWNFGDGQTSTSPDPSHQYNQTGTYTVKLVANGGVCGTDSTTKTNIITITLPTVPTATGDSSCAPKSFTLTATGTGSPYWYTSATGGTSVATGNTFNTPVLNANTTYYVDEEIQQAPVLTGEPNDSISSSGGIYNQPYYRSEIFNAYQPFTLLSVKVYASGAGIRTFELEDSLGNALHDTSINVPNGTQIVNVNMKIPQGSGMQFGVLPTANLYRNTGGAVYPITMPNVLSIIDNNAAAAGYYYFTYDWKVQVQGCVSARVPVPVKVTSAGVSITPSGPVNLCQGQSVTLTSSVSNGNTWSNNVTTTSDVVSQTGTYYTQVTIPACGTVQSNMVSVSVHALPVASFYSSVNGTLVSFTSTSTGVTTWNWNFGDGQSSTQPDPVHVYPQHDSTYYATLIVSNGSCSDTIQEPVSIVNTGVENVSTASLELYPNPTSGELILKNYTPHGGDNILFTDVLGRTVVQQYAITKNVIDISNLTPGVYFAELRTSDGKTLIGKVVKE